MNGAITGSTRIVLVYLMTYSYKVLNGAPVNVMFFCMRCTCEPKVKLALKFFTDIQQKQQAIDDKLKQLEERSSKSINDTHVQLGSTDKCNCRECNGIGRK